MISKRSLYLKMILCSLALGVLFIINLNLGVISIAWKPLILDLFTDSTTTSPLLEAHKTILWHYRLPKALCAILVGSALGVSGLFMQTYFKNPLASPYVLGISSGASLSVALYTLSSGYLFHLVGDLIGNKNYLDAFSQLLAASLGSFAAGLCIFGIALKIKDKMALLIVGFLCACFTSAIVGLLSYFSSAEDLQGYILWGFGNLGNLSWQQLQLLAAVVLLGLLIGIGQLKNLNALQIDEQYAQSVGINTRKSGLLILTVTSILCGSITSFCGPIAFVGLAVPHLTRLIFKSSDHKLIYLGVVFIGSFFMLSCDSLSSFIAPEKMLPINAVTAFVGAPIVIWVVVRHQKLFF